MKRVWQHPEEPTTGKRYWRSLGELAKTPRSQEWLEREFPAGVADMKDEEDAETSRRTFLKLMGASTALAGVGLASCRRPEIQIKPFARSPEWIIPGKALFYATAMPRSGGAVPMTVTTYEGRPTHLAGNALHPESSGGLDAISQATILDLYSPERPRNYILHGKKASENPSESRRLFFTWLDKTKAAAAAAKGKGLAILTDGSVSPTRERLLKEIAAKLPEVKFYRHEVIGQETVAAAYGKLFGAGAMPAYRLDKAKRVFSLDSDFLGLDRIGNKTTSQYMAGRKAETPEDGASMNRLYIAESTYSVTGGMADHRLRVPSSQIMKVAVALGKALGVKEADQVATSGIWNPRADFPAWIAEAAADLKEAAGSAVVIAGTRQPEAVHTLVAAINAAIGAFGTVIEVKQTGAAPAGNLTDLAKAAADKQVETLFIFGDIDPVFEASPDLNFGESLKNVRDVVVHGTRHRTATARAASWAVPGTHFLEQWGDARTAEGVYSVVQPMIMPLFKSSVSDIEVLLALNSPEPTPDYEALEAKAIEEAKPLTTTNAPVPPDPGIAYKAVRDTFNAVIPGANDDLWNNTLRDGFAKGTSYAAVAGSPNTSAAAASLTGFKDVAPPTPESPEVIFLPCSKIWDGRHINNGWLQEAPDPVSKVTWDNAALVSVKTARALGINLSHEDAADMISVTVNGVTRYYPVLVIPGHADDVVTLTLGYGQSGVGDQGPGLVGQLTGFDAYGLRTASTLYFAPSAKVAKVSDDIGEGSVTGTSLKEIPAVYPLATTQEHHNMMGRALVREGNTEDWEKDKDFVMSMGTDGHLHGDRADKEAFNRFSLYKPEGRNGEDGKPVPHLSDKLHQWGMVIDLNSCIGCSACLVACQSENNIPIVGKDQVRRGREMHWIRMDRYFATDLDSLSSMEGRQWEPKAWEEDFMDEPEMVVQPVACQHCESAPCETVCPVNATVHSPDGLNVMVYNRCIGTRYCANNCPFKARRFNFFDYGKRNPLVTSEKFGFSHGNLYDGPLGERHDTGLSMLQKNPNVSVRMRGVIEKCTYCLQRIEGARIDAAAQGRKAASLKAGVFDETLKIDPNSLRVKDGAIKTACQVACEAGAITFGNIADPDSEVSRWKRNSRNYEVLGYLSVRARTTYLARIKNPNPKLLAASEIEKRKVGQASANRGLVKHDAGQPVHH